MRVQTRTITSSLETTYTYNTANRLAAQNGQSIFAWDANGNLLQDGSTVYVYDFANRLISTTLGGVNTQFAYNGDGIRLRLIEAGTLTTYMQDYAAPLPVVLQAKTGSASTQYVYSLGTRPLAEYEAAAWEYLLPDPLGSVRQIADNSGSVTLLKSYEPYGSVLNSQGSATSIVGYAGEQMDAYIKLVFLRARYYSPDTARFLSKDVWQGDYTGPLSLNGWNYVEGNPVNRVDPSGKVPAWPPGELQAITEWKPDILASARRHNTIQTNMDDDSFASLMTVILHWEGRLPGNAKPPADQRRDQLGDLAAIIADYDASTGIANIRSSVALQILEGKIPGIEGTFCYEIEGGSSYVSLIMASSLGSSYGYMHNAYSTSNYGKILFYELQKPQISLEYLAANLQRGADRITALGFKASVFNLATWHNEGIQTPAELSDRSRGPKARSYANVMLGSMPDGFAALGLPLGRYLPYNPDEVEFVDTPLNLPPYLPIILKNG
jgi:RHS repeat-associated protein